jgi:hypothetical protein
MGNDLMVEIRQESFIKKENLTIEINSRFQKTHQQN